MIPVDLINDTRLDTQGCDWPSTSRINSQSKVVHKQEEHTTQTASLAIVEGVDHPEALVVCLFLLSAINLPI